MKVKVIDKNYTELYGKEMFVLWQVDNWYHCGFTKDQIFADVYFGKSQISFI